MLQQLTLAALIFQAAVITQTAGHGNIIVPKPTGNADHPYYFGGPAGTIDMAALVGSASYGDYYQAADEWFTKNNIASLKEYITKYGTDISECGNTEKKGPAQPVPSDGYAQHDTLGNSHPGPCEICSTTNSTSTSTTTTSAPVSASTETSVDGEASEEDKATETPVATQAPSAMTTAPETEAPAAATSAPATSSSKCVRRRS
ncbi:Beta-glucan synthesis-associated protein SKN1 [Phytophthora cinnamomi]|uniref:Beta-glucan synthesis-associated protein SKN1 n=1 Tax=Phytophthora cinnamomi TaxID=4785 RepID=UPI00355A78EA|nr:Beta-glucan synthesis-associated protein SKN1 [Phytophthora cinnamomi]